MRFHVVACCASHLRHRRVADQPTYWYTASLRTTPRHSPDFTHPDYVNPDAPKGGERPYGQRLTA
jgi:ABC-type oligopeptide transport system substrate-binding subunit